MTGPEGNRRRGVSRADRALMRRSAQLPATGLDDALRVLSRAANHGVLWWAIGAALAARKGRTRRGALRGTAAIAGASASANLIGKRVFPRRRPAAAEVPVRRRLVRRPTSSSFPSGHAASAAAFATAVGMEAPAAGLAVGGLAAAVAYSRVHTGVHWPSDVGAGVLIGVAAAAATRHWWPLHPDTPAHTAHRASAPVMRDGENMLVVVNPASGDATVDPIRQCKVAWPSATFVYPERGVDLRAQLQREIDERGEAVRALAVAGGDGTVAAVASVAADNDLPLALIPAGTLNHFARDVGVRSMPDADAATEAGAAVGIDLGEVTIGYGEGDGDEHRIRRWFVNTASLGAYPEMVRMREWLQRKHPKWPAAAIATARVLRRARPLHVELNGKRRSLWILFVGNGDYSPATGIAPPRRLAMDTGVLDVRYLRADVPFSRARFLLGAITNSLHASHVYRHDHLAELDVRLLEGNRRIATDGELGPLGNHFRFRSRPSALTIYRE